MTKKGKGLLIAAGVASLACATAAIVSRAITKTLVDEALKREEPEIMKKAKGKITGGFAEDEAFQLAIQKSKYLLEIDTERVEIESHDGIKLVGHFYHNPNAKRVLLAMHGWRSTWAWDFGAIADFWFENGCSVLFAEERGQGESDGEYMGFGLQERFDVQKWTEYLYEHNGNHLPIYLAGVSMGATAVLMAAGLPLPDGIHGLMADCGFTSPEAIWKHVCEENMHLSFGLRQKMVDDMVKQRIDHTSGAFSTIEALKENEIPLLLIHGTDDGFVPVSMTYENYKACKGPKELLIVPGADHGLSFFVDNAAYQQKVLDFWKKYD